MKAASLLLLLLALTSCTDFGGNTTIAQYEIDSLIAKPDSISIGDTVKTTLGIYLDCTNRITRIDTLVDAASMPHQLMLSVFGTIWAGSGPRPACVARFTKIEVGIVLPRSGIWIIEANEPAGSRQALRDTTFVR